MSQNQKRDVELGQVHPQIENKTEEKESMLQNQSFKNQNQFEEINAEEGNKMTCYESILNCIGNVAGFLRAWFPCIFFCFKFPYVLNEEGNVMLVEKYGKLQKILGAGLHKINTFTDKVRIVNTKTQLLDLNRQIILTNDNITVDIDAVVYFRIFNPVRCQYRLFNVRQSVGEITIAALRSVCGEYTLQQILEEREKVSEKLEQFVFQEVKNWGIYIEQAYIKDLVLSVDLQMNLSAVAKAKKTGEAKVISANSDVQCAQLLRDAANLLDSDAAMQIRYLESLQKMAQYPNYKTMFLPINDKNFENKK